MAALSHSGSFGGGGAYNFAKGLGIAMPGYDVKPQTQTPAAAIASQYSGAGKKKTTRRTSAMLFGFNGGGGSAAAGMAAASGGMKKKKEEDPFGLGGAPIVLPESLRLVLESLSDGLLEAHSLLSEALKARYETQWPLVRSLADVFMRYSYILTHYATYVCHLQRALEQIEEAALMERAMRGKRIKKERLSKTVALGRWIAVLEAFAMDHGEPGLAIFISKPFQRLLKYPLLFQNLLFHTDPSTHEFESTVEMVVEVERIVRTIEDEKVSAEERDKARDGFARIDGILDRRLLRPRADRILIEERPLFDEGPKRALSESSPAGLPISRTNSSISSSGVQSSSDSEGGGSNSGNAAAPGGSNSLRDSLRSKRSYRRLSDFLATDPNKGQTSTKAPNVGSKKDIWVIRFSDVELRCQRVGVTALPMASSAAIRPMDEHAADTGEGEEDEQPESLAKRSKDSKERLKALRNTTLRAKTRNLYKFVAVSSWKAAEASAASPENLDPRNSLMEEEEGEEEEDSDSDASSGGPIELDHYVRQSKLSFSYWGSDRVEPRPAAAAPATTGLSAINTNVAPGPSNSRKNSPQLSSVAAFRSHRTASPSMLADHVDGALTRASSGSHHSAANSVDANSVVTSSHAKSRVDKFAGRLRDSTTSPPPAAGGKQRTFSSTSIGSNNEGLLRPHARRLASGSAAPPLANQGQTMAWPSSPPRE